MTVEVVPIGQLGSADPLDGTEQVPLNQGGNTKRSTSGAFVTLASGIIVPVAVAAAVAAIVPVPNASLANMTAATVKGRASGGGTGLPQDLTQAQLTVLVNAFTTLLKGLVPAPGVVANKFLRDDGTWQTAGGSASFPLLAPDGDQLNAQYAFASAVDTGLFRSGTALAIVVGGIIKAFIGETIDLFNDADIEAIPPLQITTDPATGPVVLMQAGKLVTAPSNANAAEVAGFQLGIGPPPTNPENGDVWATSTQLFIRLNGATKMVTLT